MAQTNSFCQLDHDMQDISSLLQSPSWMELLEWDWNTFERTSEDLKVRVLQTSAHNYIFDNLQPLNFTVPATLQLILTLIHTFNILNQTMVVRLLMG